MPHLDELLRFSDPSGQTTPNGGRSNGEQVSGEQVSLEEAIAGADVIGSYELFQRSRQGVKARTANIEVSTTSIRFARPRICSNWVTGAIACSGGLA